MFTSVHVERLEQHTVDADEIDDPRYHFGHHRSVVLLVLVWCSLAWFDLGFGVVRSGFGTKLHVVPNLTAFP